ncbi:hypothetical protein MLD52_16665 [Puniceicoccaceae bacterium K14]|nr:hypothetical protein [Puniceicoccaceae bacterium K14]
MKKSNTSKGAVCSENTDLVAVKGFVSQQVAVLENSHVRFEFDLKTGAYSASDIENSANCIEKVYFSVNDDKSTDGYHFKAAYSSVVEKLGSGSVLTVTGSRKGSADIILAVTVYAGKGEIALGCGVKANEAMRIMKFSPLIGHAFSNASFVDFKTLDGENGEDLTSVSSADTRESLNNVMATFGGKGKDRQSIVFGGLSYAEFVKHAEVVRKEAHLEIAAWADDPIGKRVDEGAVYLMDRDRFYIDFTTENPFEALEKYGEALKLANHVKLDNMTAPGLNFWYCSTPEWGGGKFRNNSTGTLEALREAEATGFLEYSPLCVRLEPDDYAEPNNQQGWWDDEHWRMYEGGQLLEPYETMEKWGKAIYDKGGVPLMYCQTARRSQDYADAYPDHMLFGGTLTPRKLGKIYWYDETYWNYDFTSPEFLEHMKKVYENLNKSGVRGMKFDYPDTGWAYEGGFCDPYATTTSAYRAIFELAHHGLGWNSDIHERLPLHGDVCLGVVSTHRTEPDTDRFYPSMAMKCGLRWYKNRTVVKYVNDVINPEHAFPHNSDGWRTMFTMSYLTNGRVEIGKYIEDMSDEMRKDLTRVIPLYEGERSAKPVDAFTGGEYPQIFEYKISDSWRLVVFYNTEVEKDVEKAKLSWKSIPRESNANLEDVEPDALTNWPKQRPGIREPALTVPVASTISVSLEDEDQDGGLGLDGSRSYYVYDFWNQCFIGKYQGSSKLSQSLRPGETRMMAIHAVEQHPQFISTNRHIMQGYVDMARYPEWNEVNRTLSGVSKVVGGETYKVVIALNGGTPTQSWAGGADCQLQVVDGSNGIVELCIDALETGDVAWSVKF